jgi:DNA-directed RNA polymerase sigma subunit (sigma70/sigma32)
MKIAMDLDDDNPVMVYLRELATVPPLTEEEEVRLFCESVQTGEQAEIAKRRLLESRLPLVIPIAERYASSGLSMLDLIQEGNLGLMRALENFPKSGLGDFSAYASSCIEDAISSAVVRSQSR